MRNQSTPLDDKKIFEDAKQFQTKQNGAPICNKSIASALKGKGKLIAAGIAITAAVIAAGTFIAKKFKKLKLTNKKLNKNFNPIQFKHFLKN